MFYLLQNWDTPFLTEKSVKSTNLFYLIELAKKYTLDSSLGDGWTIYIDAPDKVNKIEFIVVLHNHKKKGEVKVLLTEEFYLLLNK